MSPTERHRTWAAINGMNTGEKRMIKCESIQIGKKKQDTRPGSSVVECVFIEHISVIHGAPLRRGVSIANPSKQLIQPI